MPLSQTLARFAQSQRQFLASESGKRQLLRLPRKRNLATPTATKQPDGQITSRLQKPVQSLAEKYSCCSVGQIGRLTSPVSRDERGARDRHERAVRCDGREVTTDERCSCVRRNRLGPSPRCRRQLVTRLKPRTGMVSQKAESPGRSRISRKAVAQGRPDASAKPVCLRAPFCCNYRTQDRGCGARPVFPAPSTFGG